MITNLHVALFPLLSTATHVTDVWPIDHLVYGDGRLHVTLGMSWELSVAGGVVNFKADEYDFPGLFDMLYVLPAGHLLSMTGGS